MVEDSDNIDLMFSISYTVSLVSIYLISKFICTKNDDEFNREMIMSDSVQDMVQQSKPYEVREIIIHDSVQDMVQQSKQYAVR